MSNDFNIKEANLNFDFKAFLMKLLSYWPLFLISFSIAFGIAYYINVRKLPVYKLGATFTIEDTTANRPDRPIWFDPQATS